MHILATFATLCCQTRWPRNHSCTTQEHVSFFRTFSGTRQKPTGQNRTFSEISTFSRFCRFCSNFEILVRKCEKVKIHVCAFVQKENYVRACSQKLFDDSANVKKLVVHKSDKCANVQKTVVHKMRKSAAQIIFRMQVLQFRKSALCTNLQMQNSRLCKFYIV